MLQTIKIRSNCKTNDCVDVAMLSRLHRAAYLAEIDTLKMLLENRSVDINERDKNGR